MKHKVFIVHDLHMPLIGHPAAMGLLVKVDSIDADTNTKSCIIT